MKKYIIAILFLSLLLIPVLANAEGLVPCQNNCTIRDFFVMLGRIYDFIVKDIATPLAALALTIGGILLLVSAGNPGLAGLGKKILWTAMIGLVLAYGSWIIVDFIMKALGFANWNAGL